MTFDIYQLKRQFGGIIEAGGTRWRGPSPGHSSCDTSCSVIIGNDGKPKVSSFTEDWRACRDHLGLGRNRVPVQPRPSPRKSPVGPDSYALRIWLEAKSGGDVVATYLRNRGITIPVPPTLRQGVGLVLRNTPCPMMVAAVQAPSREVVAVQRTFLTWQGRKARGLKPRLAKGPIAGNAVRLAKAEDVLGLAEGVETALSAMQLSGVPCWATLGTSNLTRARIPAEVRELHIFADADDAGQKAAEACAELHSRRGLRVTIRTPIQECDWNDVLCVNACKLT